MITALDYLILILYFAGLIALSIFLGRGFVDRADFFLGSRRIPAWAIGASIMATQAGVISMISAPAFVAIRSGGGLLWLQYEFAVPLAMIIIMAVFVPFFYRSQVFTIYEYLERRFDARTRVVLSVVFQLSRGLATGVGIYAAGILLSVLLDTPLWISILLMGGIALVYTAIGGMAAVIWSDVIQLGILWFGIFIVLSFVVTAGGGWTAVIDAIPEDRFVAADFQAHGLGDGVTFGFWPMVLGGLFLYASYYGCDQSQMQRTLSAPSAEHSQRALWYNGLVRFPLVLSYSLVGLAMAGFVVQEPEFLDTVPADHLDYLIPLFIKAYVPTGLTGLILAAMFAAVMSSIDSGFNALSAASVNDVYIRYVNPHATEHEYLRWSRLTTVMWGVLCTGFAFFVDELAPTVIEAINKVGSLFYGPVLATFLLAILSRKASGTGVIWGLAAGVGVNVVLWIGFEPAVSWLWWNVIGCAVTAIVAGPVSLLSPPSRPDQLDGLTIEPGGWHVLFTGKTWRYWVLAGYFLAIALFAIGFRLLRPTID